jgi:DNA-binding transcriptional MocR family regulator
MIENIQLFVIFTQPIFLIMLLSVNKESQKTIFEQLLTQITGLIENGTLKPGFRMPSSRELAELMGVNRTTIVHVYDELWAQGYIESTPGSYTYVRKRKPVMQPHCSEADTVEDNSEIFNGCVDVDYSLIGKFIKGMEEHESSSIDLMHLMPDPRLLDKKAIAGCMRDVLAQEDPSPYAYVHPRGYPPLRHEIIKHMKLHNIHGEDKNILITNGSQQSLHLILQVFSKPGDCFVLEAPSYTLLYPILQIFHIKVIEIPLLSTGMDIKSLKNIIGREPVRFIYTMPTFQNPGGVSMPQAEREELLRLCEDKKCIIIEDSIEEEMKYFGKAHLPLKSMDSQNQVIYLGTFSKVLAPGLRTGWIIADHVCIDRLTAVKTIFEISSNSLSQILLYKFCSSGAYELHLRKMMRVFRKRMKTAINAIKKYIPAEKISWTEPAGGFLIWMKILSKPIDNIEEYFEKYGVRINDGHNYFRTLQPENYIRISISRENEK